MKHFLLRAPLALAPLALAACIGPFARTAPYAYDKKGDLVEFNYAWSAEATANPAVARRLRIDLERAFKAAEATAMADRAQATALNRPFAGHRYSRRWTTAGQSSRLLSLESRLMTATGGARPEHGASALLWDRSARSELRAASLFGSKDQLHTLIHVPGCNILAAERSRRRGGAPGADGFAACPPLDALSLVPSDTNRNRRFDRFRLIAPQGVVGAYAEGSYDVGIAITPALLAAIKPAYRAGFEVGQPQ